MREVRIKRIKPHPVTISYEDGGLSFEDELLGVIDPSSKEEYLEEVRFLYKEYVTCNIEELHSSARRLRDNLEEYVEVF